MGGSGIIGEVISDLSDELESLRIDVLKEYHLPKYYTNETLVIGISASGNTEETLSVLSEANKRGFDICTFGSGGLLEKMSKSNPRIRFTRTSMLKVPRIFLSRCLLSRSEIHDPKRLSQNSRGKCA